MAKYKFKSDLSVDGIANLRKQLQDYKNNTLQTKLKEFVRRLAEEGVEVANVRVAESPLGKYVTIKTEISEEQAGTKAIIIGTGDVKQSEGFEDFNTLWAIEFGAGIYRNPVANPNSDKFGLGVGTFPGQIHAFEDGWWYWDDEEQEWRYTHGVKATMPMYSAQMEIRNKVKQIAKTVFG